jgi:hypothetical protein
VAADAIGDIIKDAKIKDVIPVFINNFMFFPP